MLLGDWLTDDDGCWFGHNYGPWYTDLFDIGEEPFDFRVCRECGISQKRIGGVMRRRFPLIGGGSIPWAFLDAHRGEIRKKRGAALETLAKDGGLEAKEILFLTTKKSAEDREEAMGMLKKAIRRTFGGEAG